MVCKKTDREILKIEKFLIGSRKKSLIILKLIDVQNLYLNAPIKYRHKIARLRKLMNDLAMEKRNEADS